MPYGSVTARNFVLASWLGSDKRTGAPATLYFALLYEDDDPTTILGTEATGGSYARVGILNNNSLWTITDENAVTDVDVDWGVATAAWNAQPLNQWAVYDASTAGNCWAFGELIDPLDVTVGNRHPVAFAGDIVITQGE